MPTVEYTKKRSLVSGSIGNAEQIEFDVSTDEPIDDVKTDELMTMGLAVAATHKSILVGRNVVTTPVEYSVANLAVWREFLHSCSAREPFLYDPTGTIAVPGGDIITVTMVPRSWRFNRSSNLGPFLMTVSMIFQETAP